MLDIIVPESQKENEWVHAKILRRKWDDEVLSRAEEAYELSSNVEDMRERVKAIMYLGRVIQFASVDYERGYQLAQEALDLAEQHDLLPEKLFILNSIGLISFGIGQYDIGISKGKMVLELANEIGDLFWHTKMEANLLVGTNYWGLGQYEIANDYFDEALVFARENNDTLSEYILLKNKCDSFYYMGNVEEALAFSYQVAQLPLTLDNRKRESRCIYAAFLKEAGRLADSDQIIDEMLKELNGNYHDETLTVCAVLAEYFHENERLQDVIMVCEDVLNRQHKGTVFKAARPLYELLYKSYISEGDMDNAIRSLEKTYHLMLEGMKNTVDSQRRNVELVYQLESDRREKALLEEQNQKLEAAVAKRTAELAASLQKEQELSQMRQQIIDTLSHEFRTPLTIIRTSAEMLSRYHDRMKPEQKANHFSRLEAQTEVIDQRLVEVSTASYASKEKIIPQIQKIADQSLVNHLKDNWTRQFSSHTDLIFQTETIGLQLETDPALLSQVGESLIDNAIKFSEESQAQVLIDIVVASTHLTFSVTNKGVGIPSGEETEIFNLFFRGNNIQAREGMGIGLYLANKKITALGGDIQVDSVDQETRFTVRVPSG